MGQMGGKAARRATAAEAAALVKSGDWVDYGFGLGQPDAFDSALAQRRDELENVKIRAALSLRARQVIEVDREGRHFQWFNWHFSGYDRKQHDAGLANYIPMNFGEAPDYYRRFIDPVDVACVKTCPMDEHGWFNVGPTAAYLKAMTERARVVIVETSRAVPYAFGEQVALHASEVDYVITGDDAPLPQLANPPITEIDRKVAERIIPEIEDGACVQIGIGGMPNAVCAVLKDSGLKNLGIHTEMFVDGMVDLIESGVVNGSRKNINRGHAVYTFAGGSQRMYSFLDRNAATQCFPVDYTNDPSIIARNDCVVAINNTTQIDLQGQAASESDGHRHLTGTGGQLQFVRGAYASRGGKAFICLASTYERKGQRKSRIVLSLTQGNVVTTPRTDTMYVVTEYGLVNLKGKSLAERAKALISIAHPDFREELERDARRVGLIPRRWA